MISIWFFTLASVLVVSLISLIGIVTLSLQAAFLRRILTLLVSFSAGALLGDVFIHLLPELVEEAGFTLQLSFLILGGILIFFLLEKFIIWRHCHVLESDEHHHSFAYTNLVGDALHNFLDGMIIAGSFLINVPLGIATTIAVAAHEIPQEIGDFGVLLHAGFSKARVLMYNFLSALAAVLGAVLVLMLGTQIESLSFFAVAMTVGAFIYIASSDLIPELHKETSPGRSFYQFLFILIGIGVMALLLLFE